MEYKHFSHPHTLNLFKVQEGQQCRCHGCQSLCYDSVYACRSCHFFLHDHCGNANRYLNHPSHPLHPLVLFPAPTYCSGSFLCNACGSPGSAFSYGCALCEVDLHLHCAFLPPKVTHKAHQHDLILSFPAPGGHKESVDEYCKICTKKMDSKLWSYCCAKSDDECDFRVHTFCATTEVKPGLYQDLESEPPPAPAPATNSGGNQSQGESSSCGQLTPDEAAAAELYSLQLQMQMNQKLAEMMASFNLSQFV